MAFSPFKHTPQLFSYLSEFPKDVPASVMSPSFSNLADAKPQFMQQDPLKITDSRVCFPDSNGFVSVPLSLGVDSSVTTSSMTDQSYLPTKKRLNLPQELVDGLGSLSINLSADINASITKSSLTDQSINTRILPPQDPSKMAIDTTCSTSIEEEDYVSQKNKEFCEEKIFKLTCEEALDAQLIKEPIKKKKRTKRIDCGWVVSNEVTEQHKQMKKIKEIECRPVDTKMESVCQDELAEQAISNDENKKKMQTRKASSGRRHKTVKEKKKNQKIQRKTNNGPVISNNVTERLKEFITHHLNGSEINLVIQKPLYASDLAANQNRLTMPGNQLRTLEFLTDQERRDLDNDCELDVELLGPTLQMYKMTFRRWKVNLTQSYVFKTNWNSFVNIHKNDLIINSKIQVWSFRKNKKKLCFALAIVERADKSLLDSS